MSRLYYKKCWSYNNYHSSHTEIASSLCWTTVVIDCHLFLGHGQKCWGVVSGCGSKNLVEVWREWNPSGDTEASDKQSVKKLWPWIWLINHVLWRRGAADWLRRRSTVFRYGAPWEGQSDFACHSAHRNSGVILFSTHLQLPHHSLDKNVPQLHPLQASLAGGDGVDHCCVDLVHILLQVQGSQLSHDTLWDRRKNIVGVRHTVYYQIVVSSTIKRNESTEQLNQRLNFCILSHIQ